MPIKVKPQETKDEFIGRCMSIEVGTYNKPEDQAFAICSSAWTESKMSRLKELKGLIKKS